MIRDDPNERLAFFRPASLPGIEVMAAYESSHPWHMFHERYAFSACLKAAAGVRYRGRDDLVTDGDVRMREPGETHCNTFVAKPSQFKILFIEPSRFEEAARELECPGAVHFPLVPAGYDGELFSALYGLCAAVEAGCERLEKQSLFALALVALLRHSERKGAAPAPKNARRAVERAKAHLRERFHESVSLDELTVVSGLSRFRLVHAFTTQVGLAPHAYQVHVRVERARALLGRGISAAAAAVNVGFADQSHFTRHFKRIMRTTPSEYARSMR